MATKLPEDFKSKWLEALRSGDYIQGTGCLKNTHPSETYCCLGVGARVAGIDSDELLGASDISTEFIAAEEIAKVPQAIVGSGAHENEGYNPTVATLIEMNDGVCGENKKSFAEIADWIEENL